MASNPLMNWVRCEGVKPIGSYRMMDDAHFLSLPELILGYAHATCLVEVVVHRNGQVVP